MMRERNKLLGHFLNNTVVAQLHRYEAELGFDAALSRITRQERRYCAMMQADIRNFTRMFSGENELEVAQLVAQCVITSYSIHYTKLYETGAGRGAARPLRAPR